MIDQEHQPLYNSRIIDTYLKLIKAKYLYLNVDELLDAAGITHSQVADQAVWFTQAQVDRFHLKLRGLTGNHTIAREAGRYGASPEALGGLRHYMLSMIGPSRMYETISKTAAGFTRSTVYRARKLAPNKVEIVVTPKPGVQEKPFQCENRLGFLEAISMVFQEKLPKVEHPECVFRGDESCRYLISWNKSTHSYLESWKNWVEIALAGGVCLAYRFSSGTTFWTVLALSVILDLMLRLFKTQSAKKALLTNMGIVRQRSEELLAEIDANYNRALVTNEIGQVISSQTKIDDILESVVQVLEKRLDFDRGMVLLADEKKTLTFRAGFGYPEQHWESLSQTTLHLDRPDAQGVFAVCFREQKPFLVNNLCELEGTLSLRSMEFARRMGAESFICCPIISDGESIGILTVDNPKSKRPLVASDISLLMGIAPMIGISIHNAQLLETKFTQFSSFLKVMAASIDARDPLTAGHSEKVTEYAMGICEELQLTASEREMIRVAALLHDYGKIGIPDSILKKNGKLTQLEYEIVKMHSYKTRGSTKRFRRSPVPITRSWMEQGIRRG